MKERYLIAIALLGTFAVAFFCATFVSDYVCRINGYYAAGFVEDQGMARGEY